MARYPFASTPAAETTTASFRCGFVALIGRPNVGKSTLLNALVGSKLAIVSPKPQTTRTRLLGIKTLPQAQLIFVDTPGIHSPSGPLLNRRMVEVAFNALAETDVAIFVVDAERGLGPADRELARRLAEERPPVLIALNKIDRVARANLLPLLEQLAVLLPEREIVPVSALTEENLPELMSTIIAALPLGPALYPDDELTDKSERVLAQEMIREQVFLQTQQEIPYTTAVVVEEFIEKPEKRVLFIRALITVERSSQRAIIIGERGQRLKQIGQAARLRLEAFFGYKIFLELFVKVSKGWTNSPYALKELGL